MADITALYHQSPPHPWRRQYRYDFAGKPEIISSRTHNPLKYYLIDFGLSRLYKPEDGPHLEMPSWGGDKSVPEFRFKEPCDPFAVDVYCIGNYVRRLLTVGPVYLPAYLCDNLLGFLPGTRGCHEVETGIRIHASTTRRYDAGRSQEATNDGRGCHTFH